MAGWQGFDGRMFLTDAEHETYKRRPPVRYSARGLPPGDGACSVCGLAATPANPLQAAHLVPFGLGVAVYALTPEWLDGAANLVWAHRAKCNKAAELSRDEIEALIGR